MSLARPLLSGNVQRRGGTVQAFTALPKTVVSLTFDDAYETRAVRWRCCGRTTEGDFYVITADPGPYPAAACPGSAATRKVRATTSGRTPSAIRI